MRHHHGRTLIAFAGTLLAVLALGSCKDIPAKTSLPPGGFPDNSPTQDAFGVPPPEPRPVDAPRGQAPPLVPAPVVAAAPSGPRQLFPHVRADLAAKLVEFDGAVPINCHDPKAPNVYLEVVACTPDTKEHETLVVTPARPSHIHAALLAAGLQPGTPASWEWKDRKLISFPPKGDGVEVSIAYRGADGKEVESPAAEWIVNADAAGAVFGAAEGAKGWVFAGSVFAERQGREVYDADGSGVLIGLTTFGSETIAWRRVISPDAEVHEPEWIANPRKVPAVGTPVVVRIRPARP